MACLEEDGSSSQLQHLRNEVDSAAAWLRQNNHQWAPTSTERKGLLLAAKELVSALEPPDTALWRIILADQARAALKVALDLKIAEAMGPNGGELNTSEFSAYKGIDDILLKRIMRVLVSAGIFAQVDDQTFKHNDISLRLSDSSFVTFAIGLSDALPPCMSELPSYLRSIEYANPNDPNYTLFHYATGTDQNMFEWLQTQPDRLGAFNASMRAGNAIRTKGVLSTLSRIFPSSKTGNVEQTRDKALLVDVGGGKGDLLERLRLERPDLKGRLILQDLPKVVEGRPNQNGVEYMAHDFFTPQPIKDASTYFFRHIFHNWPDSACLAILRHTVTAMTTKSRLVIADIVLPDTEAPYLYSGLDLQMMILGGMERSEKQWHELLLAAGLRILRIRVPTREENETASVIETVLD